MYNTKHTPTSHIMARQLASSEQNSNNNFVQLFPEMWYLDTKCASNRVRRGQKVFWSHWFLCIYAVDQNNRGEKDQSITVKEKQWCGWMNMDKSVNSFAAFLFCIWSRRYTRSSLSGNTCFQHNKSVLSITILTWDDKQSLALKRCL